MWLGIDFGTCFSGAAMMKNGVVTSVKFGGANITSLPSSVYLNEQDVILVGRAAENRRNFDPSRYQHEFKRDFGKTTPYYIGGQELLPEDLIKEVFAYIKSEAQKQAANNEPINSAVVTVPASYELSKRKGELIKQAARAAGFSNIELLTEPEAAAIYYASQGNMMAIGEILLVYDLGGGTFDAALIEKGESGYRFLAMSKGHERLGGADFDRLIYEDIQKQYGSVIDDFLGDGSDLKAQLKKLRNQLWLEDECREIKHQLSEDLEATLTFPHTGDKYQISRNDFNNLLLPLLEESCEICRHLVKDAGISLTQVNKILLVGGSCRIPFVQNLVERELRCSVVLVDEPELAVCYGAALHKNGISSSAPKEIIERATKDIVSKTGRKSYNPTPDNIFRPMEKKEKDSGKLLIEKFNSIIENDNE